MPTFQKWQPISFALPEFAFQIRPILDSPHYNYNALKLNCLFSENPKIKFSKMSTESGQKFGSQIIIYLFVMNGLLY